MKIERRPKDAGQRPRVLVIDDDEELCGTICEALRDDGFAAASVPHGAAALEMVKLNEPALLLLDLRMPIMDGWSFVQQYRRAAVAPAAIILMSANPDLPGIADQLGADGHLRKPFDLDDLRATVADRLSGLIT
ncbi:MAG TPA: response regulator [Candidatus Limnocylindria bacterium]